MKRNIVFAVIVFAVLVSVFVFSKSRTKPSDVSVNNTQTQEFENLSAEAFEYEGVDGKDAMTLLQENADTKTSASGFVTSINGRSADDSKNEFWAFYVNGEMAGVGAADYNSQNGDKIVWKIENY